MTKLCITYHMHNEEGTAETCVTLPMLEEVAEDILEKGTDSEHLSAMLIGEIYRILKSLASIQGYTYDGFCCAEMEA